MAEMLPSHETPPPAQTPEPPQVDPTMQLLQNEYFWNPGITDKERAELLLEVDPSYKDIFATLGQDQAVAMLKQEYGGAQNPPLPESIDTNLDNMKAFGENFAQASKKFAEEEGPALGAGIITSIMMQGANIPAQLAAQFASATSAKAVQMLAQEYGLWPGEAPQSLEVKAKKAALTGIEYMGMEGVGKLLGAGWNKVLGPNVGKMSPDSELAKQWVKDHFNAIKHVYEAADRQAVEEALQITPGEATGSSLTQMLENVAEGSLFGAGAMIRRRDLRQSFMDLTSKRFIESLSKMTDPDVIGYNIMELITKKERVAKGVSDAYYNKIPQLLEDAYTRGLDQNFIPTDGLKMLAKTMKKGSSQLGKMADQDLIGELDRIATLKGKLDYNNAKVLRTNLGALKEKYRGVPGSGDTYQNIKKLASYFDQTMESALKGADPDALAMWNAGKEAYTQTLNDTIPKALKAVIKNVKSTDQAERLVQKMTQKNNITYTKELMDLVKDDPVVKRQVQGSLMEHIMNKAANSADELGNPSAISGEKLLRVLYGKGGYGKNTIETMFGKDMAQSLDEFARVLRLTQKKYTGTGAMMIQFVQPQAVKKLSGLGLATMVGAAPFRAGLAAIGAGTILIAPPVLGKVMMSKKGAKYFTEGLLQLSKGGKAAVTNTTKLLEQALFWAADAPEMQKSH